MSVNVIVEANFDKITTDNDFIALDFWAPWCGPCKTFSPIFAKLAEEYPDIYFGSIDIDEQTELATDFNVRSVPTVAILRESVALFMESGALPAPALRDLIEQAKAVDMAEVHAAVAKQNQEQA